MGWYLCYFMHRHLDFRVAEFTALAELAGCGDTLQWRKPHGDAEHSPLWHVWLPSDAHAEEIMRRSILTKALIELWGEGEDVAALKSAIDAYPDERKAPFLAADRTFKVEIEDFGKSAHGTREDNWSPIVHRIDALKPSVEFLGRARMKNPDNLFWSVEVAPDLDGKGLPGDIPSRVYFGRVVARCDRSCIAKYDLTRRRYLGPTSMDVEMALIMCNMIHARPGGVVWDPFCGTGSIPIAAAHYGAMTLGTDIDIRVIRWGKKDKRTGEPVDVWTNFEDYGLPPPVGLVRMDLHKNSWAGMERVEGTLQGVVGDPPYGVRAGGRKSGGRKRLPDGTVAAVPEAQGGSHPEYRAVSLLGVHGRSVGRRGEDAPRRRTIGVFLTGGGFGRGRRLRGRGRSAEPPGDGTPREQHATPVHAMGSAISDVREDASVRRRGGGGGEARVGRREGRGRGMEGSPAAHARDGISRGETEEKTRGRRGGE